MADVTVWLPCLFHKRHCKFFLAFSLRMFISKEASCHVVKTIKQPYGGAHVTRNWACFPSADRKLKLSAHSHMNESSWEWAFQPYLMSWLQPQERFWGTDTQSSPSQIPGPQKRWNDKYNWLLNNSGSKSLGPLVHGIFSIEHNTVNLFSLPYHFSFLLK